MERVRVLGREEGDLGGILGGGTDWGLIFPEAVTGQRRWR